MLKAANRSLQASGGKPPSAGVQRRTAFYLYRSDKPPGTSSSNAFPFWTPPLSDRHLQGMLIFRRRAPGTSIPDRDIAASFPNRPPECTFVHSSCAWLHQNLLLRFRLANRCRNTALPPVRFAAGPAGGRVRKRAPPPRTETHPPNRSARSWFAQQLRRVFQPTSIGPPGHLINAVSPKPVPEGTLPPVRTSEDVRALGRHPEGRRLRWNSISPAGSGLLIFPIRERTASIRFPSPQSAAVSLSDPPRPKSKTSTFNSAASA